MFTQQLVRFRPVAVAGALPRHETLGVFAVVMTTSPIQPTLIDHFPLCCRTQSPL